MSHNSAPDFFDRFNGINKASGFVLDPLGNIKNQLTGKLQGQWQGDHFILDELFLFDNGTEYKRTWELKRIDNLRLEGTAGDVIGVAEATVIDNRIEWRYPQRLAIGKNGVVVAITDIMVMMPEGVTIGYTYMRKWGLPIGKIVTSFQRDA